MTHVTYLTDCHDPNAVMRLANRVSAYLDASLQVVPIQQEHLAEAGINLVDALNAVRVVKYVDPKGYRIILANVARRELSQGAYRNGPPFCFFHVADRSRTFVISTFSEDILGLAHRLGLVCEVQLMDIPTVLKVAVKEDLMTQDEAEEIENSQFRSLDFVPLAARLLLHCEKGPFKTFYLPSETKHLGVPPQPTGIALRIDNFGNIFTDVLPEEIGFAPGNKLELADGQKVDCYRQLAEVPKGDLAVVIGSSGYVSKKFLMVTVQGASAADLLGVTTGDKVLNGL